MVRDVNLISYLPQFMQEYKELKKLFEIEEPEIEKVFSELNIIRNNMFIDTCDENGIERFEKLLKITASKSDSLEVRKNRVKSLWVEEVPYTYKTLKLQLDSICGADGYEMFLDNESYRIDVMIRLGIKDSYNDVIKFMERVIPCNTVQNIFIDYNKHRDYKPFMYREVGEYTHKELRDKAIDFASYFNEHSEHGKFIYGELGTFTNNELRREHS